MKFIDISNQRFGRWLVTGWRGKDVSGNSLWHAVCNCGTAKIVLGHKLRNGESTSCGCYASELKKITSTTHGMSNTPEWNSFHAAKKRCNPKHAHKEQNKDWSGRGIQFRFKDFDEFYAEVGPRPEPKFDYSLDRIDNDGHYEKGNVVWATKKQQARNRRCDRCELLLARLKELESQLAEKSLTNGKPSSPTHTH